MITTHYDFRVIEKKVAVNDPCIQCGKKYRRVLSQMQTLNPYNLNSNKVPKTAMEIGREVRERLSADVESHKKQFVCSKCKEVRRVK